MLFRSLDIVHGGVLDSESNAAKKSVPSLRKIPPLRRSSFKDAPMDDIKRNVRKAKLVFYLLLTIETVLVTAYCAWTRLEPESSPLEAVAQTEHVER